MVEFDDAETLRIADIVAEDGGTGGLGGGALDKIAQIGTVEDVVAENEADIVLSDEFFTDDEGLGKTVRAWLDGVSEVDAKA